MAARRFTWLIRSMALVMFLASPLQALAFSAQHGAAMCMAADAMHRSDAQQPPQMQAEHCDHGSVDGGVGKTASTVHGSHQHCGPSCMGTCGACAHCPAGVAQFVTMLDTPAQRFLPTAQTKPADVSPDAALRPPRSFS